MFFFFWSFSEQWNWRSELFCGSVWKWHGLLFGEILRFHIYFLGNSQEYGCIVGMMGYTVDLFSFKSKEQRAVMPSSFFFFFLHVFFTSVQAAVTSEITSDLLLETVQLMDGNTLKWLIFLLFFWSLFICRSSRIPCIYLLVRCEGWRIPTPILSAASHQNICKKKLPSNKRDKVKKEFITGGEKNKSVREGGTGGWRELYSEFMQRK